jgi:rod shape determining protein RodA
VNARRFRLILSRLDYLSLACTLLLAAIGIAFIYSAGYREDDPGMSAFCRKQIVWAAIGLLGLLATAFLDYRRLGEQAGWIYLIACILLVLVLVVGIKVYGAYRWLDVAGIRIQPSELGKLAVLLALARFLGRPGAGPMRWPVLAGAALIVLPVFLLILVEPDLGSALVLIPVAGAMLVAAGLSFRILGRLLLGGLLLAPFGWFALDGYQQERIRVFLDPTRDPLGTGWNKIQSAIAIGSGGLEGKGFLQGTQNVLGFLPRTVAPTDFIFSVIAEEKGFLGVLAVLGLYALLLWGGLRAARRAPDPFGRILAAGLTALLFTHIFVNIAMTIGLLPITGLPLPLISYGGSFMVTAMVSLGILQSIAIRRAAP